MGIAQREVRLFREINVESCPPDKNDSGPDRGQSNSDGVWNEEGVALPILNTPPWWRTNWCGHRSGV